MHGLMDGWVDEWVGGWMDEWTDIFDFDRDTLDGKSAFSCQGFIRPYQSSKVAALFPSEGNPLPMNSKVAKFLI